MMICLVCEHQQDFGVECDVCGKAFPGLEGLGPPPVSNERIEGLEATLSERVGDIPVQTMGELEASRFAKVEVALDQTPDLVATTMAPVGDIAIEPMIDLSVDRVADDGSRTPIPAGPVTCRYCRNVQAQGSMCDRCGMKLPVVIVVTDLITGTLVSGTTDLKTRCRSCGAPAIGGQKCGDCGRDVPFPDA